jgi:hypothetical protein
MRAQAGPHHMPQRTGDSGALQLSSPVRSQGWVSPRRWAWSVRLPPLQWRRWERSTKRPGPQGGHDASHDQSYPRGLAVSWGPTCEATAVAPHRGGLVTLACSLFAAPCTPEAQPAANVHRIGLLSAGSPLSARANVDAFQQGLRALGYVEGQNLAIEYRYAEGQAERGPSPETCPSSSPPPSSW